MHPASSLNIYMVWTNFFLHRQKTRSITVKRNYDGWWKFNRNKRQRNRCVCVMSAKAFLCPPLRSNPATQKQVSQQPSQHWSNKCTMGSTAGQLSNNNCRLHPTVNTLDTHTCAPAVFTSALIHVSNLSGHITHVAVCGCARAPWWIHLTRTASPSLSEQLNSVNITTS